MDTGQIMADRMDDEMRRGTELYEEMEQWRDRALKAEEKLNCFEKLIADGVFEAHQCACEERDSAREENKRLRDALYDISDGNGEDCRDCVYNTKVARDVLL